MKKMTMYEVQEAYVKTLGKCCVMIGGWEVYDEGLDTQPEEVIKAAPYLEEHEVEILCDGFALVVCDNMEEAMHIFNQTVGEDGPTELNDYDGPVKIYACVYDADGRALTENT